jgi:hypothetical protein
MILDDEKKSISIKDVSQKCRDFIISVKSTRFDIILIFRIGPEKFTGEVATTSYRRPSAVEDGGNCYPVFGPEPARSVAAPTATRTGKIDRTLGGFDIVDYPNLA